MVAACQIAEIPATLFRAMLTLTHRIPGTERLFLHPALGFGFGGSLTLQPGQAFHRSGDLFMPWRFLRRHLRGKFLETVEPHRIRWSNELQPRCVAMLKRLELKGFVPPNLRPEEAHPLELGIVEVRPLELGPVEARALELGQVEARDLELGIVEARPLELGTE